MDGNATSQSGELPERAHRRRLSSILKAPRSPLKYLGSGNELCQVSSLTSHLSKEPTIEKRRASSRRVSFAENIRVFAPELQTVGSADQENEGFGTGASCSDINKAAAAPCEIAGMETLLHGPLQVPGHNADWDYSDGAKDRTIFFSSDNDMEMTANSTIAIHGLLEEKPKKIDTSQFLASLKSQTIEGVTAVEKPTDVMSKRDSSVDNKINFSDFLARLESDKSKPTNSLRADEKENAFPFALTKDNTGNLTVIFREQEDELDLTKCHTANIDSFFPTFNREISGRDNGTSQPKLFSVSDLSDVRSKDLHRFPSSNQSVFIEDDMDLTCSHTARIGQTGPARDVQLHTSRNETALASNKTIHYKENEMELTRNSSVFLNNPSVTSTERKERFLDMELTTLLPQGEDMDMTRSHTVHIRQDSPSEEVEMPKGCNKTGFTSDKTVLYDKENEMDLSRNHSVFLNNPSVTSTHRKERFFGMELTTLLPQGVDMDMTRSHTVHIRQDSPSEEIQMPKCRNESAFTSDKTILYDKENEMDLTRNNSVFLNNPSVTSTQRKERVFGVDLTTLLPQGEDMDITRSHTIRIRQDGPAEEGQPHTYQNEIGFGPDKTLHFDKEHEMELTRNNTVLLSNNPNVMSTQRKERAFGLELTTLLPQGEDMDMTRSHTMLIERNPVGLLNLSVSGKDVSFATSGVDSVVTKYWEKDPACKLHDETVNQEGDMDMTNVNAGLLIAAKKSQSWTKVNPPFDSKNQQLHPDDQDDMDMTRVHTVAIENKLIVDAVSDRVKSVSQNVNASLINKEEVFCFKDTTLLPQGEDMDITRSHTMLIEGDKVGLHDLSASEKNVPLKSALDNLGFVTNMSYCERDPACKESKQPLSDVTVHQESDMDMTHVNAGHLTAARKTQPWNKVMPPYDSFKDKTMYLDDQDDMDMTRAHTVSIANKLITDVGNDHVKYTLQNPVGSLLTNKSHFGDEKYISRPSVHDFTQRNESDQDMDITRSNTVFIDSENPGNALQPSLLSRLSLVEGKTVDMGRDWAFDKDNKDHLEKHTRVSIESPDKTIRLYEQNDMDITRTHTTTIESKALQSTEMKNSNAKKPADRPRTASLTNNNLQLPASLRRSLAEGMALDLEMTKDKGLHLVLDKDKKNTSVTESQDKTTCLYEQNMDRTRSHTAAILEGTHGENQTQSCADIMLADNDSQHPSLSRRSYVEGRTLDLEMGRNKDLDGAFGVDKRNHLKKNIPVSTELQGNTVFQCEMDITQSHTTAIDSKIQEGTKTENQNLTDRRSTDPHHSLLSRRSLVQGRTLDIEMGRDSSTDPAFGKKIGNHLEKPTPVSVESQNVTICLYGQNEMDISRSLTTAIESKILDSTKNESVNVKKLTDGNAVPDLTNNGEYGTSTNRIWSKDEDMDCTKPVFIDHLSDEPHSRSLHVSDVLSNRKSVSSHRKSVAFSDKTTLLVYNMEESDMNVDPTESLINKFSYDKTICSQGEMEMTRSHTMAIENKALEVAPITAPVKVCSPVSRTSCEIDQSRTQAESSDGTHAESVPMLASKHHIPDDKLEHENGFQGQLLEAKTENLNMCSELGSVQEMGALNCDPSDSRDSIEPEGQKTCIPTVETSDPQKDPGTSPERRLTKGKGKRVSFQFLVKDTVAIDVMSNQVPEVKGENPEHQDTTVEDVDPVSDLIDQVTGAVQDAENPEDGSLHKDPEMNVSFPEDISSCIKGFVASECSLRGRNHRRSVADIRSKIRSLSQRWKDSPHHTAPVSSLIDQLPATSQGSDPLGSEQGLNTELLNREHIQGKEPNDEQPKETAKEHRFSNRLSVKVFQPRLPNKRASSTSNILEPILPSASEAETQNLDSYAARLKSLGVMEEGQRIDEEMLPACPEDQEINSVFQYEVPEGAWEELCEKEARQQDLNVSTSQPKESMNSQKRVRYTEDKDDNEESQREKRARWNEEIPEKDEAQTTAAFRCSDKSYRSDDTNPHASKTMEQTYYSSSQDSRAGGMSVELSSQQCSQMDSQLPWDNGCEHSLWQKFQDGTITVQEFFVLLRIHILIQKPRYSERPSKRGMDEDVTASEILLDQYVYLPKLQVYEEECHTMYQTIEEMKVSTELQHKPLVQVNSVLWEALRMCSENELMYFGVTLKNMKSLYSKKSKYIAHEKKVSTYTKLLHSAQAQSEQLQARLAETDQLLKELDDCIASLEIETEKLHEDCGEDNPAIKGHGCVQLQAGGCTTRTKIEALKCQEQNLIRESLELEERKHELLGQLGHLQEEALVIDKRLQETSFSEWEMAKWTDTEAAFLFLYGSLELFISFGEYIDGENFNNQQCRRISKVMVESQLDDKSAPPSSSLVQRLIFQYIEKKHALHETYKTQKDLPQLLFDLSLVVSRCRLLGEELEYLTKWGAKYNVLRAQVHGEEIRLLFSSLAALVKFEVIIHLSDSYPTTPLTFTVNNLIGSITNSRIAGIMAKVPVGLWYLKRMVKSIHENLLG
ncbi:kinetochore scaffold 1 isoform X2 [Dendropsophus ebraccatus]|uniref:kinetochore scaffold 1 isoform X2 n=1 Tax=Dendropsophus ebraccatus TaxID=150705 RepID=UPI0038320A66